MKDGYKYGIPFRRAKKVLIGGTTVVNVEEDEPEKEAVPWRPRLRV